jgi:hypothetical protein
MNSPSSSMHLYSFDYDIIQDFNGEEYLQLNIFKFEIFKKN